MNRSHEFKQEQNNRLVATRANTLDISAIRKAFRQKEKCKNPIDLSIGMPHFPTPLPIIEAYKKALQDQHTAYSYTAGIDPLREALANQYQVHPEQVLISAGVAPLLWLLFFAVIEAEDEVLVTDPGFLIYRSLIPCFQATMTTIPENFNEEDLKKIALSKKLKMILVSNPSNPSGYIFSQSQVLQLVEFAKKNQILLVIDEIYKDFDFDNCFYSLANHLADKDLAAIVLMGFSKSYSMTGLRLGAAIGHQPTIHNLERLQQYSIVCAPTPAQHAGLVALKTSDHLKWIEYYKNNRQFCLETFHSRQDQISFSHPAGAFYFFLKLNDNRYKPHGTSEDTIGKQKKFRPKPKPSSPIDQNFIQLAFESEELLLVPGSIFSDRRNCIRLSYGVDKQTLLRGMSALLRVLDEFFADHTN